jgi:outer membrane protein assembly factor BamB
MGRTIHSGQPAHSVRSRLRLFRAVAAAALLVVSVMPSTTTPAFAATSSGWTTYHFDNARDGNDTNEPAMGGAVLNNWTSSTLDGSVYAEPLVFSGLVLVATENNTIYALNETDGTERWSTHLAPPVPSGNLSCGNVSPVVGITGTPVIDTNSEVIYTVGLVDDPSGPAPNMKYQLFALDLADGKPMSAPRDIVFADLDPKAAGQRAAIGLAGGNVYVPFGGRWGDCTPYHPIVTAAPVGGGPAVEWDGQNPSTQGRAGIWATGGEAIDGSGNVYVVTGNGSSASGTPCNNSLYDSGDSIIKLSPALAKLDFYATSDWCALSQSDQDLGGAGPVLLNNGVVFAGGKDGKGYLVSTSSMGHFSGPAGVHIANCPTADAIFGGFAYDGTNVYVPCDSTGIAALAVNTTATPPSYSVAWESPSAYSPGPPIVAGGFVWALTQSGSTLHRINPADGTEATFATGAGNTRFMTPTADSGRIFVARSNSIREFNFGTVTPPSPPALRTPQIVLPALANQAYGGYTTATYYQNTGGSPAHPIVRYYDSAGNLAAGFEAATLGLNASWSARQDDGHFLATGQAGSGILYSDQPGASFVNEFAPGGSGDATAYTGIDRMSGSGPGLFAPVIANGAFGGYTTGIGLVNLAATATNLTITYRDAGGSTAKTQSISNVPAGAYQGVYSGDLTLALPAGFAGTATISSSAGPVAAVVNETGPGGQFSSYDAVPAGSTTLFAPAALNNAYGGYFTGMSIQNTTGSAGTVTVTYFDGAGNPSVKTFALAAYGFLPVYQGSVSDGPAPGAYTARITSTVAIAAIVNEVAPGTGPAQQSTAYNSFSLGLASLHLPLVENAGSDGWSTGEGIMNAGTASTTVTVSYFDTSTGSPIGTPQSQLLQANAFWGLYQPVGGLAAGTRATAVITTSPAGQVAVICNESNATTFMSYIGQ